MMRFGQLKIFELPSVFNRGNDSGSGLDASADNDSADC